MGTALLRSKLNMHLKYIFNTPGRFSKIFLCAVKHAPLPYRTEK